MKGNPFYPVSEFPDFPAMTPEAADEAFPRLLADARAAIEEILEHLGSGGTPDPEAARDELLHTVACKAAIKAGWNTGPQERERIAE